MLITWLDIHICVSFRKVKVSMFEVTKKHTKPNLVLGIRFFLRTFNAGWTWGVKGRVEKICMEEKKLTGKLLHQ